MPYGFGVEFVLTAEVSIEAAMRETGDRHDLANRNLGETSPVEQMGGRSDNPPPRLLLVVWRVRHRALQAKHKITWQKMILNIFYRYDLAANSRLRKRSACADNERKLEAMKLEEHPTSRQPW
jgi:hypothetical protein